MTFSKLGQLAFPQGHEEQGALGTSLLPQEPRSRNCAREPCHQRAARRAEGRPGLVRWLHGNSQASPESGLPTSQPADGEPQGRGVGGVNKPHKTYHGPAGNKASTFIPSHTYTAQPTRDSRRTKQGENPRPGKTSLVPGPNRRTRREGVGAGELRVCGACRGSSGAHARRTRRGAETRARGRGRVPRAISYGAHVPGYIPASGPRPPPATAAAAGRAGPGKRQRPRRRRRRPRGEAPPASRRAQARCGGPASERRQPLRPRAAAAGGDGPTRLKGRSRQPSRRAGRQRRCAGSCYSYSRSLGAALRAPSASRPWTPEAAWGP